MAQRTRREFLISSAKGVALASIPAIFKLNPTAAWASPIVAGDTMSNYFNHFGVNEDIIRELAHLVRHERRIGGHDQFRAVLEISL